MIINFSINQILSNPKNFTNFFKKELKVIPSNINKKNYYKFLKNGNLEMSVNKKNNHIIFSKYITNQSIENYYKYEWMKVKTKDALHKRIFNRFNSIIVNYFFNITSDYKIKFLLKYLNQKSVILDIGCGNGELLSKIKICEKKIGFDLYKNKNLIKNKSTKFFFGNIKKISKNIKNNSLDMIIMHHSLEHIKDHNKLFSIIKKLLKKDGSLAITVPDNRNLNLLYGALFIPHIHNFSHKSLEDLVNLYGFNVEENIKDKYHLDEISIICKINKIKKKAKLINYKKFLSRLLSNTIGQINYEKPNKYSQMVMSSFPRFLKLNSNYISRKVILNYKQIKSKKIFINFNHKKKESYFFLK